MGLRSCGARELADTRRVQDVYHFDTLLAHSLGVGFDIHLEVLGRLLAHRRRALGQRHLGLPAVCTAGESWSKMRPPVLGTLREWRSRCVGDLIYA